MRIIALLFVLLLPTVSFAADDHCASISNNIKRVACYAEARGLPSDATWVDISNYDLQHY